MSTNNNKCIESKEVIINTDLTQLLDKLPDFIKKVLDTHMIQIQDYLEVFWCIHGETDYIITNIDVKIPQGETDTAPTATTTPAVTDLTIILRKKNCGCQGTLLLRIDQGNIKLNTMLYPIPFRKNVGIEVGVDEVGRGCLFGPVTAGAVVWPKDLDNETTRRLIKDSKLLNDSQKEEAYAYIIENAISWGIASLDNTEIDRTNILRASIKAMHMAIDETYIMPDHIIVDGNKFNFYLDHTGQQVNHTTIIKGDNKYYSIAAASIIAKVTRDREMIKLVQDHPELNKYGIASNKGYGAQIHMDGIKAHGITQWHRKSYRPCQPS